MSLRADVNRLVDDRPEEGVFRVHRDAFTRPDIFELEMQELFERSWVFVGLESELPHPNDYKTVQISRYPLLVTRGPDGQLRCFINSCRHRGMLLTQWEKGNQRYHTCRYHGWVFSSDGRCAEITQEAGGGYPSSLASMRRDLEPVARFEAYRGFLFASLSEDVPSLEEHLGDARVMLDLLLDKNAGGLELIPGGSRYTFQANWKLQIENALDIYHFGYTHESYVEILARRAQDDLKGQASASDADRQGSFGFRGGHSVQWRENARVTPQLLARRRESYPATLDAVSERWAGYGMNLTIFPNLQIVENVSSLMLRVIRPLRADLTEMEVRCLGPVGEAPDLREARIRDYEDFFGAGGLATPDDSVIYELSQRGLAASRAEWTLGYLRGMSPGARPQANNFARELGIAPDEWSLGSREVGDETRFHSTYRTWVERLGTQDASARAARGPVPDPGHRGPEKAGAGAAVGAALTAADHARWEPVMELSGMDEGRLYPAVVSGRKLVLVRRGSDIHALADRCSHGSAALSEGRVEAGEVECPFHQGRFDLATGQATRLPCKMPVPVYPVKIRNGRIEVLVGSETARVQEDMLELELVDRRYVAEGVLALEFGQANGGELPAFAAGAHIDMHLPSGRVRSYSLCGDPAERGRYRLGVQLARPSQGGSEEVHALSEGARLKASGPVNDFELDEAADFSVLIAGGIGVTPIMSMAYRLRLLGRDFAMHYACRSSARMAFRQELVDRLGSRLHLYSGAPGTRLDVAQALRDVPRTVYIYVCGPSRLIEHACETAAAMGWAPDRIRFERFEACSFDMR